MPAVITQFIQKMTFNDELERKKAIYFEGNFIPLSAVTFDQMCNPKAIFPRNYDLQDLSEETRKAALAAPRIKSLLRLPKQ
jgi:hypothetical protein